MRLKKIGLLVSIISCIGMLPIGAQDANEKSIVKIDRPIFFSTDFSYMQQNLNWSANYNYEDSFTALGSNFQFIIGMYQYTFFGFGIDAGVHIGFGNSHECEVTNRDVSASRKDEMRTSSYTSFDFSIPLYVTYRNQLYIMIGPEIYLTNQVYRYSYNEKYYSLGGKTFGIGGKVSIIFSLSKYIGFNTSISLRKDLLFTDDWKDMSSNYDGSLWQCLFNIGYTIRFN